MTERRARRIQRVVKPRQQAVIDRIQERASNLGELTNHSIAELNERLPARWILSEYAAGVDRIYNEAVALEAATMPLGAFESSDSPTQQRTQGRDGLFAVYRDFK